MAEAPLVFYCLAYCFVSKQTAKNEFLSFFVYIRQKKRVYFWLYGATGARFGADLYRFFFR